MTKSVDKSARVILADDHQILIEGLKELLEGEFSVVACATSGKELISLALRHKPAVIVTDVGMPDMDGIDALCEIRKAGVASKVVFLTMLTDQAVAVRAFQTLCEAVGYVMKSCAGTELVSAIHQVLAGRTYITPRIASEVLQASWRNAKVERTPAGLTARQEEVLRLVAQGKTMKEVAAVLQISTRTAEAHKYQMMHDLGVNSVAQLVQFAIQQGLITLPPATGGTNSAHHSKVH
jgi:DNA-binding NarL/FixJ family response regulator